MHLSVRDASYKDWIDHELCLHSLATPQQGSHHHQLNINSLTCLVSLSDHCPGFRQSQRKTQEAWNSLAQDIKGRENLGV